MTNLDIGNRIRTAREEAGITKKELAKRIHVADSTIMRYEKGQINKIKIPVIEAIANALNVNPMWLIGNSDKKSVADMQNNWSSGSTKLHPQGIRIPILGRVVAGIPLEAITDIEGYEEITPKMASLGEYFALRIKGHSMEPRIEDGEVVICKQQSDVETGDIAVVLINGDEAT